MTFRYDKCQNKVKNVIQEVIFVSKGEWIIEAYAWSKELARQWNIPFQVLRFGEEQESRFTSMQQALRGDGYYFIHYGSIPPKTKVFHMQGDFTTQLTSYLNARIGSIVVMPEVLLNADVYRNPMITKSHTLISFPSDIQKKSDMLEFNNVLRQVAFHNLPFGLFRPGKPFLFSRSA